MDSYTATETLQTVFGDFGKDTPIALAIIATASVALFFLGRAIGIRGPWPWFIVWFSTLLIGYLAIVMHRVLSGYFFLAGLLGCYVCFMRGIRLHIPEEKP